MLQAKLIPKTLTNTLESFASLKYRRHENSDLIHSAQIYIIWIPLNKNIISIESETI